MSDTRRAGHVQVVVEPPVMRDLVEAGPRTIGRADLDDLRAGTAEREVGQPRAVRANHALGPGKDRDLFGQRHALQPEPYEAQRAQHPQHLPLVHDRPHAAASARDEDPRGRAGPEAHMRGEPAEEKISLHSGEAAVERGDHQSRRSQVGVAGCRHDLLAWDAQKREGLPLES